MAAGDAMLPPSMASRNKQYASMLLGFALGKKTSMSRQQTTPSGKKTPPSIGQRRHSTGNLPTVKEESTKDHSGPPPSKVLSTYTYMIDHCESHTSTTKGDNVKRAANMKLNLASNSLRNRRVREPL